MANRKISQLLARVGGGWKKGNPPWREDVEVISGSKLFDADYYLRTYPDVAAGGVDPVEHYVLYGASEGRDPSAGFSTAFYLSSNPDVKGSGINPLRHFFEFGRVEGRPPLPLKPASVNERKDILPKPKAKQPKAKAQESTREVIAKSGLFDRQCYLERYPNVARAGLDPIDHYIRWGAAEGKNPHPVFDTRYYVARNGDVSRIGMNPLAHYCKYGWKELRNPSKDFDAVWFWIMNDAGSDEFGIPLLRQVEAGSVRSEGPLSGQEATEFSRVCHEAIAEARIQPKRLRVLVNYAVSNKLWSVVEEACNALILDDPEDLSHRLQLAEAVEKQGRVWQLAEVLEGAIRLAPGDAGLHARLGDARERMERYEDAAEAFSRASELKDGNPDWFYRTGYCLEKAGSREQALPKYAAAMARDKARQSVRFGIGVFHQARGLWGDAAKAYGERAAESPLDAELHYMHGMALDRCYRWAEAEAAYRRALALDIKNPYRHYRLGFVLERQEKFRQAAAAYQAAADLDSTHRPYWHYRAGYCLEQVSDYRAACAQYLSIDQDWSGRASSRSGSEIWEGEYWQQFDGIESLESRWESMDPALAMEPDCLFNLGRYREQRKNWAGAAEAYRMALARKPAHTPSWHWHLGFVLAQQEQWREACGSLRLSRVLKRPYGVDVSKYEENKTTKALMEYAEYWETYPIQKNTILYESFLGASVGCNPYAIFRYIVDRPEFSGWQHIWVVNHQSEVPREYAGRRNVIFIPRNCDAYRRYLAVSEYLVNNVTFPYWFIRRDGQKYLNTWHGTPIKTLGKDMKGEFMAHGNVTRNLLHSTHMISPNRHTSDVMMRRYDVDGLFAGKLAETGYPRIDQVVVNEDGRKRSILAALGLDASRPIVLYAPTWRGVQGRPETDQERIVSDVSALAGDGYQLVFRGHHFMESALAGADIPVVVAPQHIDTGDLLSVVDVLVTDYSSIAFDFLPTRRPVVYYAYDLESYVEDRGLYFSLSDLPGEICRDLEAVRSAIHTGLGKSLRDDPEYARAVATFCPFEDGESTRRAVDFFFHESDEHVVRLYDDPRKTVLMYNGVFPANGITSSFLNLMKGLDGEGLKVATLFEPGKIRTDPIRIQKFKSMPESVKCIAREGQMMMTPEEIWILARFDARKDLDTPEMWEVLWTAFRREYRRLFCNLRHDAFVHFEGYNSLITLIAAAPPSTKKTIYLHNDMIEERNLKLPYLGRLFRAYDKYDRLVSVSPAMNVVNKEKLTREFHIDTRKFVSCRNTINVREILSLSEASLDPDLVPWFGGGSTFLALGRLSPEKDHAKLLQAFKEVLEAYPNAKLVILGDGPLRQDLGRLIDSLDIAGSVKLAGLRMNPYPALKACDCFVLPSNHEGQPMVLLEAMTLGKAIIATDIDGNRGVLSGGYGRLVENTASGLSRGILDFMEKHDMSYSFDAYSYQENAISEFKDIVLSK